jgi:uncharacterized protein YkwD
MQRPRLPGKLCYFSTLRVTEDTPKQPRHEYQKYYVQNEKYAQQQCPHSKVLLWILEARLREAKQNFCFSFAPEDGASSMAWALVASIAVVLTNSAAPAKPSAHRPHVVRASAQEQVSSLYEPEAEQQLFALANRMRAQDGLPPLQADEGLTQAAREHAAAIAVQQQLSHQLPGEPSLTQRLASSGALHLDQVGENVASAATVERAHEILMLSPPHRENLLNPSYNVAGFGIVRNGDVLYVVQDFGQFLPIYSTHQAEDFVAASVVQQRSQASLPLLQRMDGSSAQAAACTMAQSNSLNTARPTGRYILRYTTMQPESLPANAGKAINDRNLRAFSVGTCYARTASYPNGVYWVTVLFY